MKTIESKDLVIGQEYYDIPDLDLEHATVLKFVGRKNGKDIFKYLRGNKDYGFDKNGCIFFQSLHMYQP